MAELQETNHRLVLESKEKLSITGVTDVDTFDEGKIILFTEDDTLIVEGENLHIQKLDVQNGELVIEGAVYAFTYTGNPDGNTKKGFFKKLLK